MNNDIASFQMNVKLNVLSLFLFYLACVWNLFLFEQCKNVSIMIKLVSSYLCDITIRFIIDPFRAGHHFRVVSVSAGDVFILSNSFIASRIEIINITTVGRSDTAQTY